MTRSDGAAVRQLIVPYTLDANDMRFVSPSGFANGEQFFTYLRDYLRSCSTRKAPTAPKMMSIGMHNRLLGKPGRLRGLQQFLDHIEKHDRVWVCRRADIARHWIVALPRTGLGACAAQA